MNDYAMNYLLSSVQANGAQVQECSFGKIIIHPTIKWPIFNWVVVENEVADLSEVCHEFENRGLQPSLLAWTGEQEKLAAKLKLEPREVHRVLKTKACDVVMRECPNREGLTVEYTSDVKIWLDTLLAGFEVPEQIAPKFHQAHSHIYQGDKRAHLYLAHLGGQPAGAALLWITHGIAAIHTATVVPEYRGYGVYQALFRARLQQAICCGVKSLATETAVPTVMHVAQKFGFTPVSWFRPWY